MDLRIVPLDKTHDRKAFHCGEPTLDDYLHRYAGQDIKRRINRLFVATPTETPERILGYYSLSAGSLQATTLPETYTRRLPGYPVPVALFGRLAITKSRQGEGLGSLLVADAMDRVAAASEAMAVYAVVVDSLNEQAANFYQGLGFVPLPSQPHRLFLPLETFVSLSRSG